MSPQATGTFEIEVWDEQPYDEHEDTKLTRTHVTKSFHSDIQGTSTAELLMAYGAVEGSAAYTGFERIVGSVNGRSGGFVLHHTATASRAARSAMWSVVPDSGTGELRGLSGEARIGAGSDEGHTFTLDYELE